VLKAFACASTTNGGKCGVFWDYVSLPQKSQACPPGEDDRRPQAQQTFARALEEMHVWYAHPKTHVLLVDTPLPSGTYSKRQPYLGRGWCQTESRASALVKNHWALLSLTKLSIMYTQMEGDDGEITMFDVISKGRADREPPLAPAAFGAWLERGLARGDVRFAERIDEESVKDMYKRAFVSGMARVSSLDYGELGWDDAGGAALCDALRYAHAKGGLQQLHALWLNGNKLGDLTMVNLASLLDEGALSTVKRLYLTDNAITDVGMHALAGALARGGLAACTDIFLKQNLGNEGIVQEALAQRGSVQRAAPSLGA
jgi:hypothetical protein